VKKDEDRKMKQSRVISFLVHTELRSHSAEADFFYGQKPDNKKTDRKYPIGEWWG